MDAAKFGTFLAGIRKEKGMTQSELAELLQVTDKAVSRWERGVGLPDVSMLEPIADVLGVSVAEVIKSEKIEDEHLETAEMSELEYGKEADRPGKKEWKEEILYIIKAAGMVLIFIAAHVAGAPLGLIRLSRMSVFFFMMICGLVLLIQAVRRKKKNVSYKIMMASGAVWFIFSAYIVCSTLIFVYRYLH